MASSSLVGAVYKLEMTTAKQCSATPILDLLQPLPEADIERINGRFAFPFLTVVIVVVLTGNLSFLPVFFGFIFVNFFTIAIHEFGHLIAGWCVGLRSKGVRIDPLATSHSPVSLLCFLHVWEAPPT